MERTWPIRGGPKRPVAERFWEKVDRSAGPNGCWPWMGARTRRSYGVIQIEGRAVTATRVALTLVGRPPQPDELACHTCDNPPCCNPGHLFVGSVQQNSDDMVAKGRSYRGRTPEHRAAQAAGTRRYWSEHPEACAARRKTHCPQGHPYSAENSYRDGRGRKCRTCVLARNRARKARHRAAAMSSAARPD